ncbi:MAG: hypothetical protein HY961_13435 [Ignavibacteriae bacterium]|nr:hypothetical protein [Ignavibacteriota bacterium]
MTPFIRHSLTSLITPTHLIVITLYYSVAWLMAEPEFDPAAIYSSNRLTSVYDVVLMSIVFLNFLFFIVSHFRSELKLGRREILASRLTNEKLFWGLVVSYLLYFLLGFALPAYATALVQQLLYAPANVRPAVFGLKALCGVFGYILFWIVATVSVFTRLRNEFGTLVIVAFLYGVSQFANIFFQGQVFNQFWILTERDSPQAYITWLCCIFAAILVGQHEARKILHVELTEPFGKGILARIAERMGADISMHHFKMMGLSSRKILGFFSFVGLLLLIPLFGRKDANLLPLAKIYFGALLPCLFSFNQYHLIRIDWDAGMMHNNFLRSIPYSHIIMNRWLLMLLPQLLATFTYIVLFGFFVQTFPAEFTLYLLALNVFFSIINLCFAVISQTSGVANLILLFFVYIQLRDDVQTFFASRTWLTELNILSALTNETNGVLISHWLITIVGIAICLLAMRARLRTLRYADVGLSS